MPKYVVVSGGVVSGLGKGITASSIGLLLRESGLKVTSIKIDPYLNIDAGTMSPYEHGEVYVLDDGGEVDLDLGNYERFMDVTLTRDHNITTGKVYESVIKREREGCYLGKTVQVVPHITDAIQDWISRVSIIPVDGSGQTPDVCIIELGGTVGDIESMVFLEALRQFEFRVGRDNFCHLHVSLIPVVGAVGEQKSKPAQHSVKELRAAGLLPQMIVCRSKEPITRSILEKISLFGMVPPNRVISVHDVQNIYQVPSMLLEQNLPALILSSLRLHKMVPAELPLWDSIACKSLKSLPTVTIGIVGKYTGLADSYLSVTKALRSAAMHADRHCKLVWVEATRLEREHKRSDPDQYTEAWKLLSEVDGILCPGGFGDRGTEGKILAAQFARENNVPYLGICLGMQVAVIEFARNVVGLKSANSSEFSPDTEHKVVIFMPEISPNQMGGNMRLGSRVSRVKKGSIIWKLYGEKEEILERHRHRYEVNPEYVERLESHGMVFSGQDELSIRQEVVELPDHKFFVGTQFHPEFKSGPLRPSPPFSGLIRAASSQSLTPADDTPTVLSLSPAIPVRHKLSISSNETNSLCSGDSPKAANAGDSN